MSIVWTAVASIVLSVLAQFLLKKGMSSLEIKAALAQPLGINAGISVLLNPAIFAGFALYGLGALIWLAVLAKWEVSKAYPLVGLGFALTVIIGFLLGEQVTAARTIGVALICAGVIVVSRS